MTNQRILSGLQPTNNITIGNYIGAMKNWVHLQNDYKSMFFVADLHSLSMRPDPELFREQIYYSLASFIAVGVDPKSSILFVQSQVPAHSELAWILNCNSYMGELNRMTQFKDKSTKVGKNIPAALFNYPTLMAADILLYNTDLVPVGVDQKQHLELTRDIATRFNQFYGVDLFKLPEPYISKLGAKIMSLQDPTSKMSKSDPVENSSVFLSDSDKMIAKKFKKAVTDSGDVIKYDDSSPGIKNLITIYCALTDKQPLQVVKEYEGKQYGHLKVDTAEIAINFVSPIRSEIEKLMDDRSYLESVMKVGAEKASDLARKNLFKIFEVVGLPVKN